MQNAQTQVLHVSQPFPEDKLHFSPEHSPPCLHPSDTVISLLAYAPNMCYILFQHNGTSLLNIKTESALVRGNHAGNPITTPRKNCWRNFSRCLKYTNYVAALFARIHELSLL